MPVFTKDFFTESFVCCTKNTKVKGYNAGSMCLGWVGKNTIVIHHWYGKKNPSTHLPFNPSVMRLGAYRFYELAGGGAHAVKTGAKSSQRGHGSIRRPSSVIHVRISPMDLSIG